MDRKFNNIIDIINRPCLLIEANKEINPIENVFLFLNEEDKHYCENLAKEFIRKGIIFISIQKIAFPKEWMESCLKKGKNINKYVVLLMGKDVYYFSIFYILYTQSNNCWLTEKLKINHKIGIQYRNNIELSKKLNSFLIENNYTVKSHRVINKINAYQYLKKSHAENLTCLIASKFDQIKEKLVAKILRMFIVFHSIRTKKSFIKRISNNSKFLDCKMKILIKNGESSSGCIFSVISTPEENFFVKGNEWPGYRCLENEICIQNKLINNQSDDYFLMMKEHDVNFQWVAYPFIDYKTLKYIIRERVLNERELKLLGEFIIKTLDKLYELNIVHRDYRIENILVVENEQNEIQKFILFDFGCAVSDGFDIWEGKKFWNTYFSLKVCGDGRYSNNYVDDAASAYLVYIKCGGNVIDKIANEICNRVGRIFV